MPRFPLVFLAATFATVLVAGPSLAQNEPLRPGFVSRTLTHTHQSEVNGQLFTATDGTRCGGFIAAAPDFRFQVAEPIEATLSVTHGVAASLVVYGPDDLRCTGPPALGQSLAGPWPAGQYRVYVGDPVVNYGSYVSARLAEPGAPDEALTYEDHVYAAEEDGGWHGGVGLLGGWEGRPGWRPVADAFELDGVVSSESRTVVGTWTAALAAEEVMAYFGGGACLGGVGSTPAHTLIALGTLGGPRLYLEGPAEAVILIEGPRHTEESTVVCATANAEGLLSDFAGRVGEYRIWVGGQSAETGDYRLRFEFGTE